MDQEEDWLVIQVFQMHDFHLESLESFGSLCWLELHCHYCSSLRDEVLSVQLQQEEEEEEAADERLDFQSYC